MWRTVVLMLRFLFGVLALGFLVGISLGSECVINDKRRDVMVECLNVLRRGIWWNVGRKSRTRIFRKGKNREPIWHQKRSIVVSI